MKRKTKVIILCILIFLSFILCLTIFIQKKYDVYLTEKLNEKLFELMKESEIIKNEIGEIVNIYKEPSDWFEKYDDNGSYWTNYIINKDLENETNIKIILNSNITKGIYAYQINGKLFYEEINNDENLNLRYFKSVY